ncbi:Der1-like family-domain-containing protein [Kickxella alabastrina]|uniref:Der1-like family-domain-containing protein n=1 Tax=Kickxella alabastrina TaxID=61397 RepID=UPI002220A468|nr:Der1-like family-domain-containing protein [Kickxella alabastrina]KAI7835138.1 Der1-like family-domain-containing protein [Kickxella alabastrina]KAJ1947541.1 hypothetical protein GGF37_000306 [Kickxella alabastrina]
MVRAANSQHRATSDGARVVNWYYSTPLITRLLLTSIVACTLATSLGLINIYFMGLSWKLIWQNFHIWRLVTGFVTTSVGLNEAITVVMLYYYSSDLEQEEFSGRTADYAWFLVFCMGIMAAVSWITMTRWLFHGVFLAVATLWSLHRGEQIVNFVLGIKLPAKYLPYAVIVLEFVMKKGYLPAVYSMLYGFAAAHLYYYLSVDLPAQGGLMYVPTPQVFYRLFGSPQRIGARFASSGMATVGNTVHQRPGGGHFWGAGRTVS